MRFSAALIPLLPLRQLPADPQPRRWGLLPRVQEEALDSEWRVLPNELPPDLDQRVRAIGEW
ncbi:hypothetical protein [uncultured Ramlibacter sp.]|uniref:hypothetical protein n=1 Tax=uncultured Ramlibacter sp. TaxID=260755 RepID=UPI00261E3A12|nr:hypothetical protein [uncultured Ramlibacter sp.]